MHFLINELSFVEQAKDLFEADELMKTIFEVIEEITVLQNIDPIQTHSSFSSYKLSPNLTVYQWILQTIKSKKSNPQKIAKILLRLLTKGPFIDIQGLIDNCKCYYQDQDVSSSSLTGAVKLKGILISLQHSSNFVDEILEVKFQENASVSEHITINNLTKIEHARKLRPKYTFHEKHDPKKPWPNASKMDLNDEEAQKVLDQAVIHNLRDGKQYYGYYNGKYYEFQPGGLEDGTGELDSNGYPLYHGYRIDENELRRKVKSEIYNKLQEIKKE